MRKFLVQGLFVGASLSLITGSAFAQTPSGQNPSGQNPAGQNPSTSGSPTTSSTGAGSMNRSGQMGDNTSGMSGSSKKMDDKMFVMDAAVGGMTEVELGKLAAQKASSDSVKQFGQKMVDDHSKANDQLKDVAGKENITVPSSLDAKHQARVDKLSKMSGASFDRAYVKDQLKDHQQDVAKFKAESQNGSDPAIKQFASSTLPTLQEHLSMVQDLSKNEKSGSSK